MGSQTSRMQCSQIRENLYEYLTGRLAPNLKPLIAEHLFSCSDCSAEHDDMKITLGLLDRIKHPQVSDSFTEKVMQSIEAKRQTLSKQPVYRYIVQAVAAATVILAIVSIIKLLPTSEKDSGTSRGGAGTIIASTAECSKALKLYNKGTGAPDLKLKESLLKDALATNCTDSKVLALIHNNLADSYGLQNRFDEALAEYTKAIELDPQLYTACMNMGDMYKKQGRKQAAIAQYELALSLLEAAAARGEHVTLQIAQMKTEIRKLR